MGLIQIKNDFLFLIFLDQLPTLFWWSLKSLIFVRIKYIFMVTLTKKEIFSNKISTQNK